MLKTTLRQIAGLKARMASAILAFGLLFLSACTTQPLIEEAKLNLAKQQYGQSLKNLSQAIEESPENADAFYYRGYIHSQIASNKSNPAKRLGNYEKMRAALLKAQQLYRDQKRSNQESADIVPLLQSTWSIEHNAGVALLEKDNPNEDQLANSIAHLTNATTIIPDSLVSHQMIALAYEKSEKSTELLSKLKYIRDHTEGKQSKEFHIRIVRTMLQEGQTDSAYAYYQQHNSALSDQHNITGILAQRYIQQEEHPRAIQLLNGLKEQYPDSVQILQNLGAQQYALAKRQAEQLQLDLQSRLDSLRNVDSLRYRVSLDSLPDQTKSSLWTDSLDATFANIEQQLAGGEYNYLRAGNLTQDDMTVLREVGIYFHNASKIYLTLAPYVSSQQYETTSGLIEDYIKTALPYLERVTEIQPQDTDIWKALYHAYSYLGMTPKADEAFKKANL
ncbi:MAG: tetratricopeptide repeat protein [Bacteroidota bacterium]